jgi:hypothetical protein
MDAIQAGAAATLAVPAGAAYLARGAVLRTLDRVVRWWARPEREGRSEDGASFLLALAVITAGPVLVWVSALGSTCADARRSG